MDNHIQTIKITKENLKLKMPTFRYNMDNMSSATISEGEINVQKAIYHTTSRRKKDKWETTKVKVNGYDDTMINK